MRFYNRQHTYCCPCAMSDLTYTATHEPPAPLRAIDVGSGRAADYDAWLGEVAG